MALLKGFLYPRLEVEALVLRGAYHTQQFVTMHLIHPPRFEAGKLRFTYDRDDYKICKDCINFFKYPMIDIRLNDWIVFKITAVSKVKFFRSIVLTVEPKHIYSHAACSVITSDVSKIKYIILQPERPSINVH